MSISGVDEECEPCIRFYREGLTVSFMKILTDEAVNSWKYNIHYCILNSCGKLLQLCALHMKRDNPYLLELLAIVLDPDNKFNTFNLTRHSDQYTYITEPIGDGRTYAQIPNTVQGTATNPIANQTIGSGVGSMVGGATTGGTPQPNSCIWGILDESRIYAKSPVDPHNPRGWLVDLINR